MIVEQIIDVPADRRITLEIPRAVPVGRTILSFTPVSVSKTDAIDKIRLLLQKEMAEKGTAGVVVESGDGWTAHARECYAKS